MNILKPELLGIEGRCYRVNEPNTNMNSFHEQDLYQQEPDYCELDSDRDDDFEVAELENGRFCTAFHISQHYYGSIIGKKAIIKRRIESETRTEIRIPKHGADHCNVSNITVIGPSAAAVKTARRKIDMIVMSARARNRPTHFISVPLNSTEFVDAFNKFKEEVLAEHCDRGLEEAMFVGAEKLHLTLGVMCLMDNQERNIASKLLAEARDTIILPSMQEGPLRIRVRGVSFMEEDPCEVSVLYATVDPSEPDTQRLQNIADQVYKYFHRAGFAKEERGGRNSIKLHMTLIKTQYAVIDEDGVRRGSRPTFDGSRILKKYSEYEFGVRELSEVHLSQRNAYDSNGYYAATCIVSCTGKGL